MAPQQLLITPAELALFGASSDFLAEFTAKPLTVKVTTAGALGVMTFQWQVKGEPNWSDDVQSDAGGPWPYPLPDPAWATLTFADGSYGMGATYQVSRTGAVTGPDSLLTAARVDLLTEECDAATSDGVTRMQPRCVPPILSVGKGVKQALACKVIYGLRSRGGMTPPDAGAGDDNVRLRAEDANKMLTGIGASAMRPPDLVDSSANNQGAGIPAMPRSRSPRGFGDFT